MTRRILVLSSSLLLLCCSSMSVSRENRATSATPVSAHQVMPGVSPEPLLSQRPADVAELQGFVDGLMDLELTTKPAASAVVAIVKDGQLLFAKGYGYADVAKRIPMDPGRTLIRPASISKLFTWTAVMQLVEQGKLDLDTDINTYLKGFQIPATYPAPITLRHLMTHTAGFEDGPLGYHTAASDRDYEPLHIYVPKHIPARVRPPAADFNDGTGAAYSNWAVTLAGYIVETVAGIPYDDYIEQQILAPLGMINSTSREPLPLHGRTT